MFLILRTTAENTDFKDQVVLLDEFLKKRDGEDHPFYAQFNKLDNIKNTVVCYHQKEPVGCGAFKKYTETTVEIKRMFIQPTFRGKGAATLILQELENWAIENNYRYAILETVKTQPEAIALYTKNGYTVIPNFGQYENIENSICMHKNL